MPARRCPLCHRANDATASQCRCGYEFGQSVAQALELLSDQETGTKILLGVLLAADIAAAAGVFHAFLHGGIMVFGGGLAALFLWTARTVQKLQITRESLRQLSDGALPLAKVYKRRAAQRPG